jgi:hypothetical protein
MLFFWALLALLTRSESEGKSERDLAATARESNTPLQWKNSMSPKIHCKGVLDSLACNGSQRGGKACILDYTHANCIDHTASRLFYGISAAKNMLIYGANVSNAFSKAPPPKQGFYILPDKAFNEWWMAKGFQPLQPGQVIPVMGAMQGHPESSRLWEKHIDQIIRNT